MNMLRYPIFFALFLLANPVFSQENKVKCEDILYLKGGTILRGKVTEYKIDSQLIIQTWSGVQLHIPANSVKKLVQKCKDYKAPESRPAYSFKERGWYHATRFSMMTGSSGTGFGVQHSSGLKFNRLLGAGLGFGLENFDPFDSDVGTYPIFAEMRGYFLPKRITPFYAVGFGYGFSKNANPDVISFEGSNEHWKGGWMAQGQIGYRIGNHAFIQLGIRLQHKTKTWDNNGWGWTNGTDQILHKRLDIGLGLLL